MPTLLPTDQAELRKFPLFAPFSSPELAGILIGARTLAYAPAEHLIDKDDDGRDIFVILKGRVRIVDYSYSGREISFDEHGPGALVGELATLGGGARSANVIAVEDTTAVALGPERFIDGQSSLHSRFAANLPSSAGSFMAIGYRRFVITGSPNDLHLRGTPIFVEPEIADLRVIALRQGPGVADAERCRQVDRSPKHKRMLLGEGRQPLQYRVRNERRHLADLGKVVWILDAMNDKVGALRQYRFRKLARSLGRDEQKEPIFATLLRDPFVDAAGIDGIARRGLGNVPVRFLQKQMDRKMVSRFRQSKQPKNHPREHRGY